MNEVLDRRELADRVVVYSRRKGFYSLEFHDKDGKSIPEESLEVRVDGEMPLTHEQDKQISHWSRTIPLSLSAVVTLGGLFLGAYATRKYGFNVGLAVGGVAAVCTYFILKHVPADREEVTYFNCALSRYGFDKLDYMKPEK